MINRRKFLACSAGMVAMAPVRTSTGATTETIAREARVKLKVGLNAYSFNRPLLAGSMTLADAVDFCAKNGVDALDATGYYFPGYPSVPSDECVYALKRTAFVNGVAISGTGVRNNFAVADEAARKRDVQMVKDWIVVASKGCVFMRAIIVFVLNSAILLSGCATSGVGELRSQRQA
jgi:hypothetical protein